MKRLIALLAAAALICGGCSDKNKNSSSESSQDTSVSAEETTAEESSESSEADPSGKKQEKKSDKSSGKSEGSQKAESSQTSQEGSEEEAPAEVVESAEFAEVKMNLNVLDAESAPNATKISIDFSAYPDYTIYGAASSGDALWLTGIDENNSDDPFMLLFKYDIAQEKLSEVARYNMESTYVPGTGQIYYAGGKLICDVYSRNDTGDIPTSRVGEINMTTGEITLLAEGEGWIAAANDDFLSLIESDFSDLPEDDYNIVLKKFDLSTKEVKEFYSGLNSGWWSDYPGEKAVVTPKESEDYTISFAVETDRCSIDPELAGCVVDPDTGSMTLSGVSKNSVLFVQRSIGEAPKKLHAFDLRSKEHLTMNISSLPDQFTQAGDSLICADPWGMIHTIYCVSPLIGTAFPLDGLQIDYGLPIVRYCEGVSTVSGIHKVTADSPEYVVYQIK
ncbi:MAG TPA: hypothetical protein DCZ62_00385 [Ruminococcus sp.]|nr:hypothetical protein [Ruminococcus sp.]